MTRTLGLLLGAAMTVMALDLAQKQLAISERGGAVLTHDRSALYVVGVAAASVVWAGAVVLTRSNSIALTGGVVLGGAGGNLVSIALWPSLPGAPDPILAAGVAFNLADVAVVLGIAFLFPATLLFATQNQERLFEAVWLRSNSRL